MKTELRVHALSEAARDPKFDPNEFGFPLKVIVDNVALTISHSSRLKEGRSYDSYTVCYRDQHRKRQRVPKADFNDAVKIAVGVAAAINAGRLDTLTLHSEDKRGYTQAVEMLKPLGVRLEVAVGDYVQAMKLLNGHSLAEAAKHFAATNLAVGPVKTVAEVVEELLQLKRINGRSDVYINDLDQRLGHFSEAHQGPIAEITTQKIEGFVSGLGLSPRSRNNYRLAIGTMLRFAVARGYLPKSHDGISGVERASETQKEEEIFTAEEIAELLPKANRTMSILHSVGRGE